MQRYRTAVVVQPGEWTQILGSASGAQRGVKTYGTQKTGSESLYLRVEP
jgi:hypothetical protein